MNLYGDYANVSVLSRYLNNLGHDVKVDTLSLYEKKDIFDYDFYYMGSGTEHRQKLVLKQLLTYKKPLQELFEANKTMLFTGNSFELLGDTIQSADGAVYEGLQFADFKTIEGKKRITCNCIAAFPQTDEPIVGFINKCSKTYNVKSPLFKMKMGFGNEKNCSAEGYTQRACFGTHITGPILVKNPFMLKFIARKILGEQYQDSVEYAYMNQSYALTRKELSVVWRKFNKI